MRPTRSEQDAPRPAQEEHARVKRELEEGERERQRLQRRIERLEKQTLLSHRPSNEGGLNLPCLVE